MTSLAALSLLAALAAPQTVADGFNPDGQYDPAVPPPSLILGFPLGDRPVHHEQVVKYAGILASESRRVRLERYAVSHGGRDLLLLIISSEENLVRLDAILEANRELADAGTAVTPDRLEQIVATTPAVAYLAYSIHGDEVSSTDAALRVAYELAAGQGPAIDHLLENLVVILDPLENPDGRARILAMSDAYRGAVSNPDPEALSHQGFWPWGRGNHYLFDLNRDWFTLVHPESRGRAAILKRFRPQLVVDSHEMGSESSYLFSPPRAPFNPNLPSATRPWWERFAADQAKAFDRHGWSYYTREWNEEFFPGYGSALALYQGAVGILYEQAGSNGQEIKKVGGGTLRYKDGVAHHFASSMANLTTAAANRMELLKGYREARAEAIRRGNAPPVRAFYITPDPDPARAARLATGLASLGIEVERLRTASKLAAARSPYADGAATASLPAGSFRVRLDQPDGLLARAVLEPHTPMPDSFLAEEREHLERQKGTRTYDVTAWSPLLGSGLVTWWSAAPDTLVWDKVESAPLPPGRVQEGPGTYGYLFDGSTDGAITLVAKLLALGVKVRAGEKPFHVGERAFPRGSFVVRTEENRGQAPHTLLKQAPASGVDILPVATARIARGPDLGGDHFLLLEPPRIAIVAGNPMSVTSVGWAWHLLDRDVGVRVSLVDLAGLGGIALDRYNVLVFPDAWGGSSGLKPALGEAGLAKVKAWVEDGGTLVALGGSSDFFADEATKLSKVRLRRQALKDFAAPRFGLDDSSVRAVERLQATGLAADGKGVASAGEYREEAWPAALGVPGPGSPVLGPGTWAMLGDAGAAARGRGSLAPPAPDAAKGPGSAKGGKGARDDKAEGDAKPEASDAEKEAQRKKVDERLRRFLPAGAILRVDLDPEQWLAWGGGDRVAVMTGASDALLARDPVVTAGRFAAPDALHLGGLLWPEAAGRIAQTAFLTREAVERGQIILFSDDPNFRGYFWGSERLFLNAVLLGPGLGTERSVPW